jgi:hypothetical protein
MLPVGLPSLSAVATATGISSVPAAEAKMEKLADSDAPGAKFGMVQLNDVL